MKTSLRFAAVAAAILASGAAQANDSDKATQADRSITFAIPSHAVASYVATLSDKSDFSVFVDRDCPLELQQMALRKLWKMLPAEQANNAAF